MTTSPSRWVVMMRSQPRMRSALRFESSGSPREEPPSSRNTSTSSPITGTRSPNSASDSGALGLRAEVDEDLFLAHLDDPALDDAAGLDRALGGDVELAREVRDLLELFCELPLDVVLGGREALDDLA